MLKWRSLKPKCNLDGNKVEWKKKNLGTRDWVYAHSSVFQGARK